MAIKPRKVTQLAASCMAATIVGCTTLSTDPLSPPLVQKSSRAVQATTASAREKLPEAHQAWLCEVKHFYSDTKHEMAEEYRTNNNWPHPYSELARGAVREPLAIQSDNAKVQLLSIWDYHFETGTGRLTTMGRNRLQTITEQSDALGHTIYVRRSVNPKETAARIDAVRTALKDLTEDADSFEIVEAKASPSGLGGDEAQKAINLLLNPGKSAASSGSSGGSSGQSGGGN